MKTYELQPANGRKSFYGKCKVFENEFGNILLKSYETEVAMIDAAGNFHRLWDGYSATTMNHVNAFIDLFGIPGGGKNWWTNLPVDRFSWVEFYLAKKS